MNNKKLAGRSLLLVALAFIYIAGIGLLLTYGNKIFGPMPKVLGPIAFLLLFVLSAAIMGALILGQPILWYLDNKKTEAVRLLLCTIGWLFVFTVAVFSVICCMVWL